MELELNSKFVSKCFTLSHCAILKIKVKSHCFQYPITMTKFEGHSELSWEFFTTIIYEKSHCCVACCLGQNFSHWHTDPSTISLHSGPGNCVATDASNLRWSHVLINPSSIENTFLNQKCIYYTWPTEHHCLACPPYMCSEHLHSLTVSSLEYCLLPTRSRRHRWTFCRHDAMQKHTPQYPTNAGYTEPWSIGPLPQWRQGWQAAALGRRPASQGSIALHATTSPGIKSGSKVKVHFLRNGIVLAPL